MPQPGDDAEDGMRAALDSLADGAVGTGFDITSLVLELVVG